jgi:hypothetical protein
MARDSRHSLSLCWFRSPIRQKLSISCGYLLSKQIIKIIQKVQYSTDSEIDWPHDAFVKGNTEKTNIVNEAE